MDEFQLWNSGVLNLGGSVLRIYYAFIEEASDDCSSPLACGSLVLSNRNSHTVINADETKFAVQSTCLPSTTTSDIWSTATSTPIWLLPIP